MSKLYTIVNKNDAQVVDLTKKTEPIDDREAQLCARGWHSNKGGIAGLHSVLPGLPLHENSSEGSPPNKLKYTVDITVDMEEMFLFEGNPHDTLVYLSAQTTEWQLVQVVTPQEYGRILNKYSYEINQAKDLMDYLELPYPVNIG